MVSTQIWSQEIHRRDEWDQMDAQLYALLSYSLALNQAGRPEVGSGFKDGELFP